MNRENRRHEGELSIPPKAESSPNAYEVVRVWLTKAGPLFSLLPEVWTDPAAWGLLIADIADHVAYARSGGNTQVRKEILEQIRIGFDMEWARRTGETRGGFLADE